MAMGRPRIFNDEQIKDIAIEMMENKLSTKEIAQKYYVDKATILYGIHKHLKVYDFTLYEKVCAYLKSLKCCGIGTKYFKKNKMEV
jgi:hypothetical protein